MQPETELPIATVMADRAVAGSRRARSVTGFAEPYLYLAPAVIILGVFHVLPAVYIIWLSVHSGSSLFGSAWMGATEYQRLLHDPEVRASIVATVQFVIGTVPIGAAIALGLALLLFRWIPGIGLFRTAVLLPFVTPVVATTVVWQWIFNPQYGFLDSILYDLPLPTVDWFISPAWSMTILVAYSIWHDVGFTVLIMLAGLTSIDREVEEAAEIDGAGALQRFRYITMPLMSPWIFFVLVINTIGAFKVFTQVLTLTGGGPGNSTDIAGFLIERVAFQYFDLPYAAAISAAVLILVSALTIVQFAVSRRTVFYQ
jgi:multiple sugar transport system permease protein